MKIEHLQTPEKIIRECVVVIDVLRAFTTAAYAFSAGATKIIPVATPEEALVLQKQHGDYLLIGEMHRERIAGFDFGNSPSEIAKLDLKGRTLVQRTSCGTQGVCQTLGSKKILVSSFVVAEATLRRIMQINPDQLTFVITGKKNADEDVALAEYLEAKMENKHVDPQPFLQRILSSPTGQFLFSSNNPLRSDLDFAMVLDLFPYAMEMIQEKDLAAIYPVDEQGNPY